MADPDFACAQAGCHAAARAVHAEGTPRTAAAHAFFGLAAGINSWLFRLFLPRLRWPQRRLLVTNHEPAASAFAGARLDVKHTLRPRFD